MLKRIRLKSVPLIVVLILVFSGSCFGQTTETVIGYTDPNSTHTTFDTFLGYSGNSFFGWDWNSIGAGSGVSSYGAVIDPGLDIGFGQSYLDENGLVLDWSLMFDFPGWLGGTRGSTYSNYPYLSASGLKQSLDLGVGYHWVQNDDGDFRLTAGWFVALAEILNVATSLDGNSWSGVTTSDLSSKPTDTNLTAGFSVGARYDFLIDEQDAIGLCLRDSVGIVSMNYYSGYPRNDDVFQGLKLDNLEVVLVWSFLTYPPKLPHQD